MYSVDTKALKKALIDNGIDTIGELSEVTGVNRNTLGDVVNGKIYPSSDVMARIGSGLNLTGNQIGEIFFYEETCT